MGRKRIGNEYDWLPKRVYPGKSAYEFRPKAGVCIKLAPLTAKQEVVIRRYDEEKAKLDLIGGSFTELCNDFFASKAFSDLASRTQKDYLSNFKVVSPVFGRMKATGIRPEHIRLYMDKRGKKSEVRANREHSFLSKVFSWAYERGRVTLNPCHNVRKFTESPRERYITDEEYSAFYTCARPELKALMEISFCCAARQGDVMRLKREHLQEEGIFIKQGKTNKAQIKKWTPRLRQAVQLAIESQRVPNLKWVFVSRAGQQLTTSMVTNWVTKAKAELKTRYPNIKLDFTFHDIKAKSISDYVGNKKQFSGHKSDSMIATYDRKTEVVDTHE